MGKKQAKVVGSGLFVGIMNFLANQSMAQSFP